MYKTGIYISDPVGNNEFHYYERISLGSKGKIFVPSLITGNLDDLKCGSEIAFEEVEEGKLVSCIGLKNFIATKYQGIPTYIFDNHNHALFFRYQYIKQFQNTKPFKIIHIDQHADTKPNPNKFKNFDTCPEEIINFTNYKCNVGNFLTSTKETKIIDEIIQIRSKYALHNIFTIDFQKHNYILDIDVDFRENTSQEELETDFTIIRKLITNICLITIATSPYFMEQTQAIMIIKKLLHK